MIDLYECFTQLETCKEACKSILLGSCKSSILKEDI